MSLTSCVMVSFPKGLTQKETMAGKGTGKARGDCLYRSIKALASNSTQKVKGQRSPRMCLSDGELDKHAGDAESDP